MIHDSWFIIYEHWTLKREPSSRFIHHEMFVLIFIIFQCSVPYGTVSCCLIHLLIFVTGSFYPFKFTFRETLSVSSIFTHCRELIWYFINSKQQMFTYGVHCSLYILDKTIDRICVFIHYNDRTENSVYGETKPNSILSKWRFQLFN